MAKVTTRDVASEAGVSQSTVSLVFSGKATVSISQATRVRVEEAARRLGYRAKPKRMHADTPTTIGILTPTLSNLYYPFLIQHVEKYAASQGVDTIIINTLRDPEIERKKLSKINQRHINGLLCLYTPKAELPSGCPIVIVSEKQPDLPFDTVCLNSFLAGQMMASHLISLGHERIAYVATPIENITSSRRLRLDGIRSRLAESGLEDQLVVMIGDEDEKDTKNAAYEFNVGQNLTAQLLDRESSVTAIIAVNDMTAAGCLSTLNERGVRVPGDIALCGFDNLLISRITSPQLTTMDQMAYHGSIMGFTMLLNKLNEGDSANTAVRVEYEPRLYVRGSTAEKS